MNKKTFNIVIYAIALISIVVYFYTMNTYAFGFSLLFGIWALVNAISPLFEKLFFNNKKIEEPIGGMTNDNNKSNSINK